MAKHQSQAPKLYAQPLLELLNASSVMGGRFERPLPRPSLPQTTSENAAALFHFVALTTREFKQATKTGRTPAQTECLRFLQDLREDLAQVAHDAGEMYKREGVKHE